MIYRNKEYKNNWFTKLLLVTGLIFMLSFPITSENYCNSFTRPSAIQNSLNSENQKINSNFYSLNSMMNLNKTLFNNFLPINNDLLVLSFNTLGEQKTIFPLLILILALAVIPIVSFRLFIKNYKRKILHPLTESEKRYKHALLAISDGHWDWDINKNKVYFNLRYWQLLGYKTGHDADTLEEGWLKFVHPDDKKEIHEFLLSVIQKRDLAFKLEYRMITKGNDIIWIVTKGKVIERDENNNPTRVICANINNTKQRKAEENLKRSEEFVSKIIDLIPHMILAKDEFGRFLLANKAVADEYGVTTEELRYSLQKDYHPDYLEFQKIQEEDQKVIKSNKSLFIPEEQFTNSKGITKYYQTTKIPFQEYNYERPAVLQVSIDITDQKAVENSLKNARDSAEAASRAKSEFLANMSHEIRTPMNSIIGFAELLSFQVIEDTQRSYIDSIKTSGKNLLELINGILDLSKIEAGKFELQYDFINTYGLFEDLKGMFDVLAKEKGLEFIIEIDPSLPIVIFVDELRLRQVLVNIIGNAIKFTDKGYVKIMAESPSKKNENDNSYANLEIKVEDTGIGISKEFQERLFETFQQQDGQSTRKYEGTGLGLALAKRFVEMMNGKIYCSSKVGSGTIFSIYLNQIPYKDEDTTTAEKIHFDLRSIVFKNSSIIIADDNEINRKFLSGVLKETNLKVIEAKNGQEAYDLALKQNPDLIMADIRMPDVDGFKLIKMIKNHQKLKNIPVIANSASVIKEEREEIEKYSFDDFLMKPIEIEKLLAMLAKFLPHEILDMNIQEENEKHEIYEITESPDVIKKTLNGVNKLMGIWKEFTDQQPLEEIELFGNTLLELGETNNVKSLVKYGTKLVRSVQEFDIEKMLRILKQFPQLVEKYEVYLIKE